MSLVGYIKVNSKFVKIFSLKQKEKSNTSSYYTQKTNFYSSRKQCMVPLDKGLQWVNVK